MKLNGSGLFSRKENTKYQSRRRRQRRIWARFAPAPWRDRIAAAFAREREARRCVAPLEYESALAHVFECACCGRIRREEERREPDSEVCVRCVRAAGFYS